MAARCLPPRITTPVVVRYQRTRQVDLRRRSAFPRSLAGRSSPRQTCPLHQSRQRGNRERWPLHNSRKNPCISNPRAFLILLLYCRYHSLHTPYLLVRMYPGGSCTRNECNFLIPLVVSVSVSPCSCFLVFLRAFSPTGLHCKL